MNFLPFKSLIRFECRKTHVCVLFTTFAIIALILGLGLGLTYRNRYRSTTEVNDNVSGSVTVSDGSVNKFSQPTSASKQPHLSGLGSYSKAAVASDGRPCAKIGV